MCFKGISDNDIEFYPGVFGVNYQGDRLKMCLVGGGERFMVKTGYPGREGHMC